MNYHDTGTGESILLIHGSGPGVSAWANWRGIMPALSNEFRVIAPDMAGFGYTTTDEPMIFSVYTWVQQISSFLDKLNLERVHVVGNSFGGAIALHLAREHPERVGRIVLMGAVSLPFQISGGLEKVWGYTPSINAMRELMGVFAFDKSLITEELISSRYEVSTQRGMDKIYESLFPAPRQRWVDALAQEEAELRRITHETLIVHGRDDRVIPLEISVRLLNTLPNSDLIVFGKCGHWTQIEKRVEFVNAVKSFLSHI
ncbi:MAG: alpha/beta hydrolase [Pseudomonadota bacterium]